MKVKTGFVLLAALGASSAWGCASPSSEPPTEETKISLHRAKGCTDLLSDFKADAAFKVNKGIDRQVRSVRKCAELYGETQCANGYGWGGYYGGAGRAADANSSAEAGGASPTSPSPSSSSGGKASSYSETNTQVKGVDEADFVKTDGTNIYLLHGRAFKVLKAWPATALGELSTLDIEGEPTAMFVEGGNAVIYSTVNGASLLQAAGIAPKTSYRDYSWSPSGMTAGATYAPLTKITVLKLEGNKPSVSREVYFEGSYLDSRRVGSHVRTVLSGYAHGPKLKYGIWELYPTQGAPERIPGSVDDAAPVENPYPKTASETIAALERLRSENLAAIAASQLTDWLPNSFVKNGGAVSARTMACEDFYVPTTGSTESGFTEVASIDLADPAGLPRETGILGHADTVYASADTLYLASNAWVEPPWSWDDGPTASGGTASSEGGSAPAVPPTGVAQKSLRPLTTPAQQAFGFATNRTHLHKFEFKSDPKFPNYVATGTVVGSVKNQFSLDDKDGYLRVATTENRMYVQADGKYVSPTPMNETDGAAPERPSTLNHVFVLGQNGPWLDPVSHIGNLAANEQIYSVRFVGGRGYVVTFRRVDPLFVIDLQDPKAPSVLAALKIPGFSEYMHPLDETHLLTIGRDASDTGRAQGLQLQIFDVADGKNPILTQKFTYTGSEYGSSEAEYDHKAFTYFADKKLLAFPYFAYTNGTSRSSLELFKVDVQSGFSKLGSIDHTPLFSKAPQGYCGGWYGPQVRRGIFLENFVYSISYGGVVVKNANDIVAAGAQLALPAPQSNNGYGAPGCAL